MEHGGRSGLACAYPQAPEGRGHRKTKNAVSTKLTAFLELLTRFELVTRSTPKTRCVFGDPGQWNMGDAPALPALTPKPPKDEVTAKQKTTVSKPLTVVSGAANQI